MRVAHDLARVRAVNFSDKEGSLIFGLYKHLRNKVRNSGDHSGRPPVPQDTSTEG